MIVLWLYLAFPPCWHLQWNYKSSGWWNCCRKWDLLQGPRAGSCLTLGNGLSEEEIRVLKKQTIGNRCLGGEQQGKGTQEDRSATWVTASGFMVMGLVSRLSLANHSDSGCFRGRWRGGAAPHASLSQDGCQQGGPGMLVQHTVWCLLLTFRKFFQWVLAC